MLKELKINCSLINTKILKKSITISSTSPKQVGQTVREGTSVHISKTTIKQVRGPACLSQIRNAREAYKRF